MAKANRICHTCKTEYHHCPTCPSETKKETFYNMFCCERCSKIFKTLTDETFKRLTISECKEQLLRLNVSIDEDFKEGIKNHLKRVFNYEEPEVELVEEMQEVQETQEEINVISNDEVAEEVSNIETSATEEPIKKMNYVSKKNRKSRNNENSEVD